MTTEQRIKEQEDKDFRIVESIMHRIFTGNNITIKQEEYGRHTDMRMTATTELGDVKYNVEMGGHGPTYGFLPQPTLYEAHSSRYGGLQAALQAAPSLAWSFPRYAIFDGGFLRGRVKRNEGYPYVEKGKPSFVV